MIRGTGANWRLILSSQNDRGVLDRWASPLPQPPRQSGCSWGCCQSGENECPTHRGRATYTGGRTGESLLQSAEASCSRRLTSRANRSGCLPEATTRVGVPLPPRGSGDQSPWTYQGKTPAVLPAASECKEQEASQRTGRRVRGGGWTVPAGDRGRRQLSSLPGRAGTAWTRRPRGSSRQVHCSRAGMDCDAWPIYSSLRENTELESPPCGCGARPAPGRGGSPPGREHTGPGVVRLHSAAAPAPGPRVQKAGARPPGFREKRL